VPLLRLCQCSLCVCIRTSFDRELVNPIVITRHQQPNGMPPGLESKCNRSLPYNVVVEGTLTPSAANISFGRPINSLPTLSTSETSLWPPEPSGPTTSQFERIPKEFSDIQITGRGARFYHARKFLLLHLAANSLLKYNAAPYSSSDALTLDVLGFRR
jgi:hypothetical protein